MEEFIKENKIWDMEKLITEIGSYMVRKILRIQILFNGTEDEICWGLTGDGIFLIKLIIWLVYDFFPTEKANT